MDLTTAVTSLGNDYVNKVSDLLTNNSVTSTNTSQDSTFDSIFNSVSGLLDSTNNYIQQAQQAEVDFALGNMTNTHELGVYQQSRLQKDCYYINKCAIIISNNSF